MGPLWERLGPLSPCSIMTVRNSSERVSSRVSTNSMVLRYSIRLCRTRTKRERPWWGWWCHLSLMVRQLKCAFINVNSVFSRHKRHFLKLFLHEHKPDILMIAEHKLNARNNLRLDGYVTHIQNRIGCRGGGTAILINNNIHCVWFHLETHNVESTAVEIYRPNGTSISVVA